MSTEIQAVTFAAIEGGKWADNNNPDYLRMAALREQLAAMQLLWQGVANAQNGDATTAAYEALKADVHKIVDLTGIIPANVVFLGGSRKKRQSKKKKNQRKHHNNQ